MSDAVMPKMTRRHGIVLLLLALGGGAALTVAAQRRPQPAARLAAPDSAPRPTLGPTGTVQPAQPTAALPSRRADQRLDSTLARLVTQLGQAPPEAIAAQAPLSRGTTVAVSIRTTGDSLALHTWITAHGGTVANVGVDVTEAYVPVTELQALAAQPGVGAVAAIIPAEMGPGR